MWLIHGVNYDEPSGVGCQIFRHTGIPQYWVLERQKCSAKMLRVWSSMNAGFKLLHLRVGTTPPNPEDLHTKICYKNWDCWGFFGNDGNTWAKGIHAYQTCGTKTRNGPKKTDPCLVCSQMTLTRHWSLFPIHFPGSHRVTQNGNRQWPVWWKRWGFIMISGALLVGGNDGVRQWGWDDIPYPIYYGKYIYIYGYGSKLGTPIIGWLILN